MTDSLHHGLRYKRWRDPVLWLGDYKCCLCGGTDDLTADHIKPVVTHPQLAFVVSNGRVLCNKCRIGDMLDSWSKLKLKKGGTK